MGTETNWTLGALLEWTAKHLAAKKLESPRLDAEVLLAHAVGCKRIDLYGLRHAESATPEIRTAYKDLIRKRLEGCPVAYLVGRKEFFGLEFQVGPSVLIPRPDTEHLVIEALDVIKKLHEPRVLDIGVGSGCIAVALAKNHPNVQLTAIDLSDAALKMAESNAKKHGVDGRIRFVLGDACKSLTADDQYEVIVSNPPYITQEEMKALPVGVKDYEPHQALAGGADGFAVFDRILDEARAHLRPEGTLLLEIGSPQEQRARAKFQAYVEYELGPTIYDSSKHPRVLKARRS